MIESIVARCKYGLAIEINQHHFEGITVERYLANRQSEGINIRLEPRVALKMIARDTVVYLGFSVDEPNNVVMICHYDLSAALVKALEILDAADAKAVRENAV